MLFYFLLAFPLTKNGMKLRTSISEQISIPQVPYDVVYTVLFYDASIRDEEHDNNYNYNINS